MIAVVGGEILSQRLFKSARATRESITLCTKWWLICARARGLVSK